MPSMSRYGEPIIQSTVDQAAVCTFLRRAPPELASYRWRSAKIPASTRASKPPLTGQDLLRKVLETDDPSASEAHRDAPKQCTFV
jgi:hypothetical protein